VARRLHALLENLIQSLPRQRVPLLKKELALLEEAAERQFPAVDDRFRAATPDYQGIGSALPRK
jgi:hypothetical protein